MERNYQRIAQHMGGYTARHYLSPEENQKAQIAYIRQQQARQAGYGQPSASNGYGTMPKQMQVEREMAKMLQEADHLHKATQKVGYYRTHKYLADLHNYTSARDFIQAMLAGKAPISLKEAYYAAEYAFGDLHLTYQEYDQIMAQNAAFIRHWLTEYGYSIKDPEALHFGIQRFMSDTLELKAVNGDQYSGSIGAAKHVPYQYDYIDFTAEEDRRNYFVSKTLATGTGQCHTLPVTYLLLAEALGVEAHLAYNPQHSFIRYRNNAGTWINFETTIGRFMSDQMYSDALPVSAAARRSGLMLTGLSQRQVLASILIDLAASFIKEHWLADGAFVRSCLEIAEAEFPNQPYINTASHYVKRRLLADDLNRIVRQSGITNLSQLHQHPAASKAYKKFKAYTEAVSDAGFQGLPEEEYIRMMQYHDQKERLQKQAGIDTKSRRSLFIKQ